MLRVLLRPLVTSVRKFRERVERNMLRRAGKEIDIHPSVHPKKRRYGLGDGEWTVAECEPKVVYSFGVGKDIRFELDILKRHKAEVHSFDPTPKAVEWISKQNLPHRMKFHPWGIADFDGTARFRLPQGHNVSYVMGAGESEGVVKRLASIMKELGHSHVDIVKIDIEGAEYAVIDNIAKSDLSIGQILVEFHHRFQNGTLKQTEKSIQTLQSIGYQLFDVSARGLEYGFIKGSVE